MFLVRTLDLSHNNLDNINNDQNGFLNFTEIRELYLHHNKYTHLPHYYVDADNIFTLADLIELQVLDLSCNAILDFITGPFLGPPFLDPCPSVEFTYEDFSQIRELYFQYNDLPYLPDYVYQAKHLTVADFSYNNITFSKIWPTNTTIKSLSLSGPKTIHLESNLITDLDLSVLNQSVISQLHHILQNFHFHLDGNPINCGCNSFRMFKYLISSSKTERLNEQLDEKDLPDFSFYETNWKCQYPPEWAGKPIMDMPENEYDKKCVENLDNCPPQCHCYTSWKRNHHKVMEYTGEQKNLRQLPEYAPRDTLYFLLAGNDITSLCGSHSCFQGPDCS